jgi:hypothetical protein
VKNLQDQHTVAKGPNFAGCPCETFDYGCCSDGVSVAQAALLTRRKFGYTAKKGLNKMCSVGEKKSS